MDNQLDASFAVNVPVPRGANITITGLSDTRTGDGVLSITSQPAGYLSNTGNFSQGPGTLLISVVETIPAHTNVTIYVTLINPPAPVGSKLGQVTISLDTICGLPQHVMAQPSGSVIRVRQATFDVARIGQATSWPGAANVLTITLNAAVPLYGSNVRCETNITITGFDGACFTGASLTVASVNGTQVDHPHLKSLTLTGPNASLFQNVAWHSEQHAVVMRVNGPLGGPGLQPAVFSIGADGSLINPVSSQPSPRISIAATGIAIPDVAMNKDVSRLQDSQYDHNRNGVWNDSLAQYVGSQNGAIFNATDRSAEPLRVVSPAFRVRMIGQSSPYPGDNNTLSVTISPNIDISVGAVLELSSLYADDGSSAAPTGTLPLTDGSTEPAGKSTADDTRYFAAYAGGAPGAGLWDDSSRSLTLFVVHKLTAGSFYSFKFVLKNPLCPQLAQPVCIRARNIQVGCENGVNIARRLMEHDLVSVPSTYNASTGHAAPLLISRLAITNASLRHSSPFASANNTLTVSLVTNVPLLPGAFAPIITISNLVGTVTTQPTIAVTWTKVGDNSTELSASWDGNSGTLEFSVPSDTVPGHYYTASFELKNKNCEQSAPQAVVSIGSAQATSSCWLPRPLLQLTSTHCSVPTSPLQILGAPCSGSGSSSAMFTLKNISQQTPYPGCTNTITVQFMTNIPLRYDDGAAIELSINSRLAVGLSAGNVQISGTHSDRFFGERDLTNETSLAQWSPGGNAQKLILNVARGMDLLSCVPYTFSFTVVNPMTDNVKASQPHDSNLLQAALPVEISVTGTPGVIIPPVGMQFDYSADLSIAGTSITDRAPFRVHRPTFLTKTISQSSPYPGSINSLVVTIAANTPLHVGAVIAVHRISEAIAAPGNLRLNGTDAGLFMSLTGDLGFGTWDDCEKALLVTPVSDLPCDGTNMTFSFDVYNPVNPHLCAEVLMNATQLNNPQVFRAISGQNHNVSISGNDYSDPLGTVHGGIAMLRDTWSVPANIHGSMAGDSCPMTVWAAAFLVKNIGQSNNHPCGLNTIYVTLATNVPLHPTINYPGRAAVQTKITIQGITGAIQDDLSAGSKSIQVFSQGSSVLNNQRHFNASNYFTDASDNANMGTWQQGIGSAQTAAAEPSLTIYPNPSAASCCMVGADNFFVLLNFSVYNPPRPQRPSRAISIAASGIPIISSSMREDIDSKRPMHLLTPQLDLSFISQSDASPCALNTITVSLRANVDLYARCQPIIVLSQLQGLTRTMFSNITSVYSSLVTNSTLNQSVSVLQRHEVAIVAVGAGNTATAPQHLSAVAEWYNATNATQDAGASGMTINITATTVPATSTLSFQFRVRNGALPYASRQAPMAGIRGIGMQETRMSRPSAALQWPITIAQVGFEEASISQSTPFPAAENYLTVSLRLNQDLSAEASCAVNIVITGLQGACVTDASNQLTLQGPARANFSAAPASNTHSRIAWQSATKAVSIYLPPSGAGLAADTTYAFSFKVRNPSSGQASPAISIEAFGIPIPRRQMEKNPSGLPPQGVFGATAIEGEPLFVRGLTNASSFLKASIGQSSADPGASNVITLTLQVNVPLTASAPTSAITLSGLRGAVATHGPMPLNIVTSATSGSMTGTWDDTFKTLVLSRSASLPSCLDEIVRIACAHTV